MRFSVWVILGISVTGLGFGLFYLVLVISLGWQGNWESFLLIGLPPMLIGVCGISFLYVKRKSPDTADESTWVAMIMYAAFGAYFLWYIYTQTVGYGTC